MFWMVEEPPPALFARSVTGGAFELEVLARMRFEQGPACREKFATEQNPTMPISETRAQAGKLG